MLTRSAENTFNPMRFTGFKYGEGWHIVKWEYPLFSNLNEKSVFIRNTVSTIAFVSFLSRNGISFLLESDKNPRTCRQMFQYLYAEKSISFSFQIRGLWLWWQFPFSLWTKINSIRFIVKKWNSHNYHISYNFKEIRNILIMNQT